MALYSVTTMWDKYKVTACFSYSVHPSWHSSSNILLVFSINTLTVCRAAHVKINTSFSVSEVKCQSSNCQQRMTFWGSQSDVRSVKWLRLHAVTPDSDDSKPSIQNEHLWRAKREWKRALLSKSDSVWFEFSCERLWKKTSRVTRWHGLNLPSQRP